MGKPFYIGENDFRVFLGDVNFIEKSEDEYNSRQICGIMTTDRIDRQGESVVAKGLEFKDFLSNGHFNDNHSQETSAIIGYPEAVNYHEDMGEFSKSLEGTSGWSCTGYVLKGTKRSDGIWELAKSLMSVPSRKLGFSIEGKVERRKDKTIVKANIRNVAITNCPVNTDAQWDVLAKSFNDEDTAIKAMSAGFATAPAAQSGGGAIRSESLEHDKDKRPSKKNKTIEDALKLSMGWNDLVKSTEYLLEQRPDFDLEAAVTLINHLYKKGVS